MENTSPDVICIVSFTTIIIDHFNVKPIQRIDNEKIANIIIFGENNIGTKFILKKETPDKANLGIPVQKFW